MFEFASPMVKIENSGNGLAIIFESEVIGEAVPNPRVGPPERAASALDGVWS